MHQPSRPRSKDARARVAAAYDAVADRYDQTYRDPMHTAEDRWLARWLNQRLVRGGQVIDLGCGTGWFLDQPGLWDPGSYYLGLDISPGMLARAAAKHPGHTFRQQDMAAMQAPGIASTVVSTFGSLNYHPAPQAVLMAAAHALRPGGRLLLSVYGPAPHPRAVFNGDAPPMHRLHPTALRWMTEGAGLHVRELRGFRRTRPLLPPQAPAVLQPAGLRLEQTRLRPERAAYLLLAAEKPR